MDQPSMEGIPLDEAAKTLDTNIEALRKRCQRGSVEAFKKQTAAGEQWFLAPAEIERLKPGVVTPQKDMDSQIDLALSIFDWFTDKEHFELNHRNEPVFSIGKLCRDLALDKTALRDSLLLLERNLIIGRPYLEPTPRGRELRTIGQSWLEPGSRERLRRILRPEPTKPHIPWGTARVLAPTSVYVGRHLMSFKPGEIVRDEQQVIALLAAGRAVAKLEETSIRMCADQKCRHRFDASEQPTLDYPVMEALSRQFFTRSGAMTVTLKAGDLVTDRGLCLFMTTGVMKERLQYSVRELSPSEYTVCPKCLHVSRIAEKTMVAS